VTLGTILLIVLVLMLVGAFPRWSHSRSCGYGPQWWMGIGVGRCPAIDGTDLMADRVRRFAPASASHGMHWSNCPSCVPRLRAPRPGAQEVCAAAE
jgi:hypothetical protein